MYIYIYIYIVFLRNLYQVLIKSFDISANFDIVLIAFAILFPTK